MDKLGPPLQTERDVQRFYDSDTKTDSTIKRPDELLPVRSKYYTSVWFIYFAKLFLLRRKLCSCQKSASQYVLHINAVGEE